MPDVTLASRLASELGRRIEASDHDDQTSDIRALNTGKANKDEMTDALATKANAQATTDALALKANAQAMTDALALKADTSTVNSALALKATTSQLTDVDNNAFINSLLF